MSQCTTDRSYDQPKAKTNRREFIKKSVAWAGGSMIAFSMLRPMDLQGQITEANDSRLTTSDIQYQGESGQVRAYLAKPKAEGKYPAIIVIHENKGLQPHIKDVTRRFALEGFVAMAPDALSAQGGTPATPEEATPMFQKMDYEVTKKDFVAAVAYLKTNPQTTGKVGCTGFCWGGAMTNQVAVHSPQLNAAVPYYGSAPKEEDVPNIKASMLLHYAGDDERINQGIPAYEAALKKANIDYKLYIYP
ncbi:MAG: dienelactone hydrolase family protein, partial [Verrucomicrobia bacterium]|nr:dienelactone hydrolase family protein [Prolixibacteraceae bacterium]